MQLKIFNPQDVAGKRVLLRVDFNVPLSNGVVTDDTRINAHIPTIKALREAGARIALCSHLGRPKGTVNKKYTLEPVAKELEKLTGWKVRFVDGCIGEKVDEALPALDDGEILMLENVRFHPEEEKCDREFAKKLANNFDVFVMDAFSAAHRAHASTRAVAEILPSFAGFLINREISMLSAARDDQKRPFVLILGGSKVSDKIAVVENMIKNVNTILVGGGMAFTFLKAQGKEIGNSLCEKEKLDFAKKMLEEAKKLGVKILLPVDVVVAKEISADADVTVISIDDIPNDQIGLDIGPKTAEIFAAEILSAKKIIWNGPMGVFETDKFANGTKTVANALVDATVNGALTVVGGGDSAEAMTLFKLNDKVCHVSTGGGASLEFFEGKTLPGVEPYIIG